MADTETKDTSGSEDWFQNTDQASLDKEKEDRSKSYARKNQRRVWIPPKAEYDGVFLDDTPRAIHEHNLYINGTRKGNWWTCIKKLDQRDKPHLKPFWGGCPMCLSGDEAYYVAFVSILNVSGFTIMRGPDKGKTIKMFRQLFPMKLKQVEWFNKEKKIRKSLVGAKYSFSRPNKTDPFTGVGTFVEKVDLDDKEFEIESQKEKGKIYKPEPFDYSKILAPIPRTEMEAIIRAAKHQADAPKRKDKSDDDGGDGGNEGYSDTDDDIPFIS